MTVANDSIYLSWLESKEPGNSELVFSKWNGESWSARKVIVSGVPFFVNWADFPSLLVDSGSLMAAHWLEKSGEGTYAYDVRISTSTDQGATWAKPVTPHTDNVKNEHGFVSLVKSGDSDFSAIWLDARKFQAGASEHELSNEMSLVHAAYKSGEFQKDQIIDERVCDCCQTSAAPLKEGAIVVYRDRSKDEVRDISYMLLGPSGWSTPRSIHPDNWKIAACPVNGPSVATRDEKVAVAWFTAADNQPKVQIKFSQDSGKTFPAQSIRVDGGNPVGRVDVDWWDAESVLVCWMENTESQGAQLTIRRVWTNGKTGNPYRVAASSGSRSSGFPRLAVLKRHALIAWTDPVDEMVRTTLIRAQ